jgi:hypothetical protein
MLGAVPPVPVVVDLVDVASFTVPNPVERGDARVGPDRDARIDRLDVTSFWKDLELYEFLAQRGTVSTGITGPGMNDAIATERQSTVYSRPCHPIWFPT